MSRSTVAALALLVGCVPGFEPGPERWPCPGQLVYAFEPNGTPAQRQDAHDLMWEIGLLTGRFVAFDPTPASPGASARGRIEIGWRPVAPGRAGWTDRDAEGSTVVGADVVVDPGARRHRAVLAHELGHAVGLEHVPDPTEIMHPNAPVDVWGPGDRAGIAALGACR